LSNHIIIYNAEKVNHEIQHNFNIRNVSDKTDLPRMIVQRRKIRKQRWNSLDTTQKETSINLEITKPGT
jgi:hypothetical protein